MNSKTERSYQGASGQLDVIIKTAVDGIIIINEVGTIQLFNPACEKLFKYSAKDIIGKNIKTLMPPPYREEHDGYLSNYITTGAKKIIGIGREVSGMRKDGSTFPMELSVGEAEEHGARFYVGIIRDITERKRAQEEIEDNVRELAAFSYSVAHDLKAPLRAIAGFSNALEEDYTSILDETAKEYLAHIGDGVTHMGEMIDDLLEYSRIGRDDLPFKKMPVRQLIDYAINNHRSLIEEMGAEIIFDGEWCEIEGHQASLLGVFQNLIGNAIKFARPNVRPVVELHGKVRTHEVEISIADNGIGIPEDCRDKVFHISSATPSFEVSRHRYRPGDRAKGNQFT